MTPLQPQGPKNAPQQRAASERCDACNHSRREHFLLGSVFEKCDVLLDRGKTCCCRRFVAASVKNEAH